MSNLLERYLKSVLSPGGTSQIVRLGFHDGVSSAAYYTKTFVDAAIEEMTKRLASHAVDEITALERLAIELLLSSAYISKPADYTAALESFKRREVAQMVDPESDLK